MVQNTNFTRRKVDLDDTAAEEICAEQAIDRLMDCLADAAQVNCQKRFRQCDARGLGLETTDTIGKRPRMHPMHRLPAAELRVKSSGDLDVQNA